MKEQFHSPKGVKKMLYITIINFHSNKFDESGIEVKRINADSPEEAMLKASKYCESENKRDTDYNNWIGMVKEIDKVEELI